MCVSLSAEPSASPAAFSSGHPISSSSLCPGISFSPDGQVPVVEHGSLSQKAWWGPPGTTLHSLSAPGQPIPQSCLGPGELHLGYWLPGPCSSSLSPRAGRSSYLSAPCSNLCLLSLRGSHHLHQATCTAIGTSSSPDDLRGHANPTTLWQRPRTRLTASKYGCSSGLL